MDVDVEGEEVDREEDPEAMEVDEPRPLLVSQRLRYVPNDINDEAPAGS